MYNQEKLYFRDFTLIIYFIMIIEKLRTIYKGLTENLSCLLKNYWSHYLFSI